MKAKSCFSTRMDPYRAGLEIGEALAALEPEVIFLFSTIHFEGSKETTAAIYEVLGNDQLVIVGSTGDGFYEQERVADAGLSALALNSEGAVRWHLAWETGVGESPRDTTARCMKRLHESCGTNAPALYYLATDFRTDTSELVAALQEAALGPVVGGSAGDDTNFDHCFVYANREVHADCVAILAAEGELAFDIRVAHQADAVGNPAFITESSGTTVLTVDNIPTMDFIERELGKPVDASDEGLITLKLMDGADDRTHVVRSLLLPRDQAESRAVSLFGGIEERTHVQVCLTPADRIIQDVGRIVRSVESLPFEPVAGLIVSCAGRKQVLADNVGHEVRELTRGCPSLQAIAGFPSFGEFGPVKTDAGYSPVLFHNMAFILLLLGGAPP